MVQRFGVLPPLHLGDALDLFGQGGDLSSATVWYLVISYCFWGFFAALFA